MAASLTGGLTVRRRLGGVALAGLGLPLLTVLLATWREHLTLTSDILAVLVLVVGVALLGGLYPALAAAVVGFGLLNYFFTPPLHRFTVAEAQNVWALLVFVVVAATVSTVVDIAARRTSEAARARAEAETLSTLAGSVLRGERPLRALLEQLRETFGLTSVTLLERRSRAGAGPDVKPDGNAWRIAESVGGQPCVTPGEGNVEVPVGNELALVLRGHPLATADRRLVEAFAAQAAVALRQQRLAEQVAAVGPLAEVDRLRTALLAAVSHDLRTPLASAKAAVTSLRSSEVDFSDSDRTELLATAEESLDKLTRLVDNLLDMSRLQAGALGLHPELISVAEAIPRAIDDLGPVAADVVVYVPEELPEVHADAALLERVLANILTNALRFSPPGRPPMIAASEHGGQVQVRVVDHGPGIPIADRERVFQPFQRLGDRDNESGVGLGLALSRGLAEAMGGHLEPETTPGGGLTMTLSLPGVRTQVEAAP